MKNVFVVASLSLPGLLAGCADDAVAAISPAQTQNPATVFINELHYDNASTDVGEAVEIAGPAGTDLTGWSVVLYNGNPTQRTSYSTRTLSGVVTDQQGGYGAVSLSYSSNGIQNGGSSGNEPDAVALVNAAGDVVQFLSYEGAFTAANGPAGGLTSTDIGVSESGTEAAGLSLQLKGGGATYQDFSWAAASESSFGAPNAGQTFGDGGGEEPVEPVPEVCGDAATLISAVQGSAAASPLVGQTVTLEAVVVGDFQGADGLNGFYLQEETGDQDGDPETSEGISVFAPGAEDVSIGERVRVTGTVAEFGTGPSSLTQLGNLTRLQVCGPAELPPLSDLTLPLDSAPERLEGMRVALPQTLVISEYFNYDRFGEVVLALPQDGLMRPYTPTSYVEPGDAAQAVAAENARRRITLDDGLSVQNPQVTRHPNGEPFTLSNRFRGGDTVTDTVGVLDQRFGLYRVQPTQGADYEARNPRTAAPDPVGGSVKVASFNVLNYFTTLDDGSNGARGADNAEEFERQQAKIVAALAAIDADIFGLIEIENNGDTAVQALVDALNAEVGEGTYSFVPTGSIGTDAIKVAFIYKPATVTPVGDYAVLDSSEDPRFIDTKSRPVLIQTFDELATGGRATVAVNHFKSKGSSCNDVGDPDLGDGQGNCNETRTQAAAALVDYLKADPTGSGDPDFLIIGDLNSYDEEDPIDTLKAGADDTLGTNDDYTDLNEAFGGEFAYSYVFDAQFGYLDYALSNEALTAQVTGTTEWHINADEPDLLDYDTTFKSDAQDALYAPDPYRSSDHDPVVVGLALTPPDPQELLADLGDVVAGLGLGRGDERALLAPLETASRHLQRDRDAEAEAALERFEAQVSRLVGKGALTAEQGQALTKDSSAIRALF